MGAGAVRGCATPLSKVSIRLSSADLLLSSATNVKLSHAAKEIMSISIIISLDLTEAYVLASFQFDHNQFGINHYRRRRRIDYRCLLSGKTNVKDDNVCCGSCLPWPKAPEWGMFYWLLVAWFSDYLLLLLCVYASDECTCVSKLECLQSMVQVQNHTNIKLICLKTFFTPTEFSLHVGSSWGRLDTFVCRASRTDTSDNEHTNGALGLFEHNFYLLAHDY